MTIEPESAERGRTFAVCPGRSIVRDGRRGDVLVVCPKAVDDEVHTWEPYCLCPCGCGVRAAKLKTPKRSCLKPNLCAVGCQSRSCISRRNVDKGRRGQTRGARRAGWTRPKSTADEEAMAALPQDVVAVKVDVQQEAKVGSQVPAKLVSSLRSVTFERWMKQARLAVAAGSGAKPGVYIEPEGGGAWLIVEMT